MDDAARQTAVLKELERHGNVSRACDNVGIPRSTFYWMLRNTTFQAQVRAAIEIGRK